MAATITYLGTMLNGADSTTNWVGGATLETTSMIHGTGCMGLKQAVGTGNVFLYNFSGGVDFTTGDKHFYIWGLAAGAAKLDTKANGGVRIRLGTATGTYYDWYMDGNNTYTGGWKKFVINPNSDPDGSSGSPNLGAITYLGLVFNCLSGYGGANLTIFVDAIHIGTGLQITGTSTTDAGFEDIFQDDIVSSKRYGVIDKIGGVYFVKGELVFGSTSSTNPDFSDINSTVVFEDQRTSATLYKINLLGHSSDSTNSFRLGTAVGTGASTIGSKGVTIAATGSASTTGTWTYNNLAPATITRGSGSFKTDGLKGGMFLQITGTASNNKNVMCATVAALTITLVAGETLTDETVSSTITGSRRVDFTVTNANVKTLKLYGSTIKQAGTISLGSTSTAISPTIELVDTTFSNTRQIVKNVTTASPLYLRNSVSFDTNLTASMNLYDAADTASGAWKILQGTGFQSTATGAPQTILLSDHDFTIANKPYITLETDETWNGNDLTWTIATQTELNFGGSTLSGASVNSRKTVSVTVQTPSGTKLENARVKIVEADDGTGSPAIANSGDSTSDGLVSFDYLRQKYEGKAASALTITVHATQSLKAYQYGKLGYFSSIDPVDSRKTETAALNTDTFQVETVEETAVLDGTDKVVIVESTALDQSHSIIKVTSITGNAFAAGNVLTGGTSGASGTIEEIIEGTGAIGTDDTIILKLRNATAFSGTEAVNRTGGGSSTLVSSSEKRFYWLVQAGTISSTKRTLQQLYDHFQAKLAQATLDTGDNWHKVVIDGRAELATPIQGVSLGSTNSFKTICNTALTHGWVISGLYDLSGLNSYTANDSTTFIPLTVVTLSITVINSSNAPIATAQCAIYKVSDDTQLMNEDTETVTTGSFVVGVKYTIVNVGDTNFILIGAASNAIGVAFTATGVGGGTTGTATNGTASQAYTYLADTDIYIRVRKSSTGATKYIPTSTTGTITSSGFSTTITLRTDTNA